MAMKFSVGVRNAKLNAVETTISTSPKLYIRSGAPPAATTDADSGTLLCTIDLPSDWMNNADAGAKTKLGTWSGVGSAAAGTGTDAGHFRIKESTETTTHIQGTVGESADTPDLVLDNKNIAENQTVTVNTFTLTSGNA